MAGILLASLISAYAAQQAWAEVLTSASTTAPVKDVLLSIAPTGVSNLNWFYKGNTAQNHRDVGQTFLAPGSTATTTLLKSVVLQISTVSAAQIGTTAPGASFTLSIYKVAGADSFEPVESIYSETGNLPSLMEKGDFLTFDLNKTVSLVGDTYYAVSLAFNSPDAGRNLQFTFGVNTLYANGSAFTYSNASAPYDQLAYANGGGDLRMVLVTVPEPGTVALAGGGVAFFLATRMRKIFRPASGGAVGERRR